MISLKVLKILQIIERINGAEKAEERRAKGAKACAKIEFEKTTSQAVKNGKKIRACKETNSS